MAEHLTEDAGSTPVWAFMHTHFPRGKKVLLLFKDGGVVVASFKVTVGKYMTFLDYPKVKLEHLRSVTIYRRSPREV